MLAIGPGGVAKIHGDAVLDDSVLFEDLVEDMQRAAAIEHVVFRDDFEPIDERFLFEDVLVVRHP